MDSFQLNATDRDIDFLKDVDTGQEKGPEDDPPPLDDIPEPTEDTPQEPPGPPPLSPDDRRKLIFKIRAYISKFPKKFGGLATINDWETKDDKNLQNTLEDLRFQLQTSSTGSLYRMFVESGVQIWETAAENAGFPIPSTSTLLKRDEEWEELMKEFELEYGDVVQTRVEWRMGLKLLQTSMLAYHIGKQDKNKPRANEAPLDQAIFERWKDL